MPIARSPEGLQDDVAILKSEIASLRSQWHKAGVFQRYPVRLLTVPNGWVGKYSLKRVYHCHREEIGSEIFRFAWNRLHNLALSSVIARSNTTKQSLLGIKTVDFIPSDEIATVASLRSWWQGICRVFTRVFCWQFNNSEICLQVKQSRIKVQD